MINRSGHVRRNWGIGKRIRKKPGEDKRVEMEWNFKENDIRKS